MYSFKYARCEVTCWRRPIFELSALKNSSRPSGVTWSAGPRQNGRLQRKDGQNSNLFSDSVKKRKFCTVFGHIYAAADQMVVDSSENLPKNVTNTVNLVVTRLTESVL